MTCAITYDWNVQDDELELFSTDEILSAYEDGRIGARIAMRLLELEDVAELQEVMDFNRRTMPWARDQALSDDARAVLDEALGLKREATAGRRGRRLGGG